MLRSLLLERKNAAFKALDSCFESQSRAIRLAAFKLWSDLCEEVDVDYPFEVAKELEAKHTVAEVRALAAEYEKECKP